MLLSQIFLNAQNGVVMECTISYVQCSNWNVATSTSNIQNIFFIRFGCKFDFCPLLVAACMDTRFVNIYWQHRNPFSKTNLVLLRLVSISRCTVPVPTALTICPSPRLTSLGLASFLNAVESSLLVDIWEDTAESITHAGACWWLSRFSALQTYFLGLRLMPF